MNNTNRALNRVFVAAVGLLILVAGAVLLVTATVPAIALGFRSRFPDILRGVRDLANGAPLPGGFGSWWLVAAAAVLAVLIVLLLAFIFRQGHGHTPTLITEPGNGAGQIVIDARVAEQLLGDALDDHRAFVASHVSTYDVRGQAVLKVAVVARRGVSPTDIAAVIDPLLDALNSVLGREVAASIQIGAGIRTRTSAATRLE